MKEEPGLRIGGRSLHLMLTVNPSGIVTQTELDDPAIRDAALGACVQSAVRGLVFPMFTGEPVQIRVALALGGKG